MSDPSYEAFGEFLGKIISSSSRMNVEISMMILDLLIEEDIISSSKVKEFLEQRISKLQNFDLSDFEEEDKREFIWTLETIKRIHKELFEL